MSGGLLAAYRSERRALELPGLRREDLGSVVRYTPLGPEMEGVVTLTELAAEGVEGEIGRHLEHFRAAGVGFEWKVYDTDTPADLAARLLRMGFAEGEREALMVREAAREGAGSAPAAGGVEVRLAEAPDELEQLMRLQERVWERDFGWLLEQMLAARERTTYFGAHAGGTLVGSGWIEYPAGSSFAEIHGGAVLPGFRGRGIYAALLEHRMADAARRGVPWVAVDAAPLSRPILQAKGFRTLDWSRPLRWHPSWQSAPGAVG